MNSNIIGSTIVVASKDQVSCELAGEVAILDVRVGIYYSLNPVGAYVWNLIQTPRTLDEVCEAVLGEYDVDAEHCTRDVLALLKELVDKGLVEIHGETIS